MWYKLKRIMMWVNNQEKQVRPPIFPYSYDFKSKTKTNLTNDWWSGTMNWTIDSWGLHWDDWWIGKQFNFSNATKITITVNINITQKSSWSSWDAGFVIANNTSWTYKFWGWASTLTTSGYRGMSCCTWSNRTSWNNTNLASWTWVGKSVIDLVNWTITTTYSQGGSVLATSTYNSLTATDIANIKSYTYLYVTTNWNGCYIEWISVDVN